MLANLITHTGGSSEGGDEEVGEATTPLARYSVDIEAAASTDSGVAPLGQPFSALIEVGAVEAALADAGSSTLPERWR